KNLPPRSIALFEDETDLLLFPPLRAAWARRGQDAAVPISGKNAKRVVYGTLNIRTGNRLLWALQGHRAVDFQEFMEVVHWYHRGGHIVMVLDQESSHTAAGSAGGGLLSHPSQDAALGASERAIMMFGPR